MNKLMLMPGRTKAALLLEHHLRAAVFLALHILPQ